MSQIFPRKRNVCPVALLMRAYRNDISQLWTGFLLNLFKSATCVLCEDKSASQIIAQSYQRSHWKVVPRRKFQWRGFFSQRNSAFQRINRILKGFFASHLQLMVSLRRNNGFSISWTFQITSLVLTPREYQLCTISWLTLWFQVDSIS